MLFGDLSRQSPNQLTPPLLDQFFHSLWLVSWDEKGQMLSGQWSPCVPAAPQLTKPPTPRPHLSLKDIKNE